MPRNIMITKRDLEILSFINRFGKMTSEDVKQYIGKSIITTRKVLKKLKERGYIKSQKIFHNQNEIITCTEIGAEMTPYRTCVEIKLSQIEHDLIVGKMYHPMSRKISHEKYYTDRDMKILEMFREHRPDIVFETAGRYTAVEIELHKKADQRMLEIRKYYEYGENFEKVIYLVQDEGLENYLLKFFSLYPKFEVLNFKKIIA
ncbi:MAG: hypothetical protein RIR12_1675 [Bacteroidota bacterium]|jgi:DNA-binding Lrp family transcriptional regulator